MATIKLPLTEAIEWAREDNRRRRIISPSGAEYRVSCGFLLDSWDRGPAHVDDLIGRWTCHEFGEKRRG